MLEGSLSAQSCEVVRQEACSGRAIGPGGKDRQNPSEIAFRIHADQPACRDDGIDDRGAPTGGRMPDEEVIPKSDFSGSEAALDRILIDVDVTKADLRVPCQVWPTAIGVGHSLAQVSRRRRGVFKRTELSLQALQDGFRPSVPQQSSLLVGQAQEPCEPLDAIELRDIAQERYRLPLIGLLPACASQCAPDHQSSGAQDCRRRPPPERR